jgi:prepilin-type N-terminal cleavage/methylation domain-containing protein
MKAAHQRRAFTLVELLVGMLAGSVLAVTAGLLLYYGYGEWRRNREGVAMQQDGRVAMEVIGRAVRAAATAQVAVVAGELHLTNAACASRFRAAGGDLLHDPNLAVAGDERPLVSGRLLAFGVSNTLRGVQVTLQLRCASGTHNQTIQEVFTCRN